ncbi:hypothetical protein [Demequina globuliformis]|uniref:hypothetical protein n=1 Tax=Demequina globuliformis TaxID=676202 RepID=UPI0007821D7D|nr:hypothetical protein [Demequina globuliformis]
MTTFRSTSVSVLAGAGFALSVLTGCAWGAADAGDSTVSTSPSASAVEGEGWSFDSERARKHRDKIAALVDSWASPATGLSPELPAAASSATPTASAAVAERHNALRHRTEVP